MGRLFDVVTIGRVGTRGGGETDVVGEECVRQLGSEERGRQRLRRRSGHARERRQGCRRRVWDVVDEESAATDRAKPSTGLPASLGARYVPHFNPGVLTCYANVSIRGSMPPIRRCSPTAGERFGASSLRRMSKLATRLMGGSAATRHRPWVMTTNDPPAPSKRRTKPRRRAEPSEDFLLLGLCRNPGSLSVRDLNDECPDERQSNLRVSQLPDTELEQCCQRRQLRQTGTALHQAHPHSLDSARTKDRVFRCAVRSS